MTDSSHHRVAMRRKSPDVVSWDDVTEEASVNERRRDCLSRVPVHVAAVEPDQGVQVARPPSSHSSARGCRESDSAWAVRLNLVSNHLASFDGDATS